MRSEFDQKSYIVPLCWVQKNGIPLPYRKKETERERKTYIIILSYIVKCEKNVVYVLGIYLEKNLCTVHPVHAVQRISCYPHTYRFIMTGNGRKKHVGLKMVHLPPTYIVTMMPYFPWFPWETGAPQALPMIFPCFFSVNLGAQERRDVAFGFPGVPTKGFSLMVGLSLRTTCQNRHMGVEKLG